MQCKEAEQVLCGLVDQEFPSCKSALHLHLSACRDCRELLVDLLWVKAMCRVTRLQWGNGFRNSRESLSP